MELNQKDFLIYPKINDKNIDIYEIEHEYISRYNISFILPINNSINNSNPIEFMNHLRKLHPYVPKLNFTELSENNCIEYCKREKSFNKLYF